MEIQKQRKKNPYLLPSVLFITAVIHFPALFNHLVADSWVFVQPRSFMDTLGYFSQSIIPQEWDTLWLRPLPMLFFWLDNHLWSGMEWGPHLTNLIFHLINVFCIWQVVLTSCARSQSARQRVTGEFAAWSACLIYGIHPLNVGSVDWVAARFDVMSVTFGLISLLFWFRWESKGFEVRSLILCVIFSVCTLLSKEQGIIFPVTVFLLTLRRAIKDRLTRKKTGLLLLSLAFMVFVYLLYRVSIFHGLGGYLQVQRGMSIIPPFAFLTVILFPFLNIYDSWTISLPLVTVMLLIPAVTVTCWSMTVKTGCTIRSEDKAVALILFAMGLATTAPHAAMNFKSIVHFSESRFALLPLTGLSILAGYGVSSFAATVKRHRIVLILIIVWGIAASWRTSVQIQAWKEAGTVADSIVTTAVTLAPNPPPDSRMYFFEIPRSNKYYAYIFGIGLKEAVLSHYPGREDITIIPNASGKDLRLVKPERDYVFGFNKKRGMLERLYPKKKESTDDIQN